MTAKIIYKANSREIKENLLFSDFNILTDFCYFLAPSPSVMWYGVVTPLLVLYAQIIIKYIFLVSSRYA